MRFFGILNMWRGWQKAFVQIAQRGIWSGWKPHKYWVFPHCMWGCIVLKPKPIPTFSVPSLYVRVYRPGGGFRLQCTGSLTVCEGVSRVSTPPYIIWQFPHYMWGCIVASSISVSSSSVPSLYVRVYRMLYWGRNIITSFLIICEGVSVIGYWFRFSSRVPSLYVRVYRICSQNWALPFGSLIICEGVSATKKRVIQIPAFPHYMCGCIGWLLHRWYWPMVPSLYVRVYLR